MLTRIPASQLCGHYVVGRRREGWSRWALQSELHPDEWIHLTVLVTCYDSHKLVIYRKYLKTVVSSVSDESASLGVV